MEISPLLYWIPYKLNFASDEILCNWLFVGDKSFSKPFFESSIDEFKNNPLNQHKYKPASTLEAIYEFSENTAYLKPTAFIFHISRSGSTLLSQLFTVDPKNIVVAEAPFFDEILREINFSKHDISETNIIKTFIGALNLLGKKRKGNEQNFFIKLDSWHLMYFEIIRKAFPDTPFIFSYRKPKEVINSHQKQPGIQAVPGLIQPEVFDINITDELLINHEKYITLVLEKYFEKLIEIVKQDTNALFIDYVDGIFTNIDKIQTFLKLEINDSVKKDMEGRAQFHSKNQFEIFNEPKTIKPLKDFQKKVESLYQKLKELN